MWLRSQSPGRCVAVLFRQRVQELRFDVAPLPVYFRVGPKYSLGVVLGIDHIDRCVLFQFPDLAVIRARPAPEEYLLIRDAVTVDEFVLGYCRSRCRFGFFCLLFRCDLILVFSAGFLFSVTSVCNGTLGFLFSVAAVCDIALSYLFSVTTICDITLSFLFSAPLSGCLRAERSVGLFNRSVIRSLITLDLTLNRVFILCQCTQLISHDVPERSLIIHQHPAFAGGVLLRLNHINGGACVRQIGQHG